MPRLDLTREAAAIALDPAALSPDALDDHARAVAIETWRGRMLNEHISARVFAALIPQMMRAEIDAARQAEVAEMIADELRHARQCAAVVAALGGAPVGEIPALPPVPTHDDVAPLEGFLRNILSVACMSETVAVALISAERMNAGPELLKRVLGEILADEVQHARFGWRLLEELAPQLPAELKQRLGVYLVFAFAHLREHELAHLPATPGSAPSRAAEAVGVCDGHEARRLFFETVYEVIIPGLEDHGIPAAAAWEASLVSRSSQRRAVDSQVDEDTLVGQSSAPARTTCARGVWGASLGGALADAHRLRVDVVLETDRLVERVIGAHHRRDLERAADLLLARAGLERERAVGEQAVAAPVGRADRERDQLPHPLVEVLPRRVLELQHRLQESAAAPHRLKRLRQRSERATDVVLDPLGPLVSSPVVQLHVRHLSPRSLTGADPVLGGAIVGWVVHPL